MKTIILLALIAMVACEAPFSRQRAPYPPAGYRPAGAPFRLPERQEVYGPPEYFPPAIEGEDVTTEAATTEYPALKQIKKQEKLEEVQSGVYYIYHPNGLLQKISYTTKNDVKNMGYTAQLKYEDVEAISDPVYTYDPESLVLEQIRL